MWWLKQISDSFWQWEKCERLLIFSQVQQVKPGKFLDTVYSDNLTAEAPCTWAAICWSRRFLKEIIIKLSFDVDAPHQPLLIRKRDALLFGMVPGYCWMLISFCYWKKRLKRQDPICIASCGKMSTVISNQHSLWRRHRNGSKSEGHYSISAEKISPLTFSRASSHGWARAFRVCSLSADWIVHLH